MDRMEMAVFENISSSLSELFLAEQKVAGYVLENPNEVVTMNVSDLAEKSGTSEATVVRTAKHLGYDGYYQMRLLLSRDIGKTENLKNEKKKMTSSQKYFSFEADRVRNIADMIDFQQLLKTAKILIESRNVHVVSVGNTVPIAMDLGFRLERAGISCTYAAQPEHFYNHITLGNEQDTVIAITRSGSSTQVIRAVELAHHNKMKIIVIAGEMNRLLTDNADCVLLINDKAETATIGRPDSHLIEYAINDAILYVLGNMKQATEGVKEDNCKDKIGILLSEFKL